MPVSIKAWSWWHYNWKKRGYEIKVFIEKEGESNFGDIFCKTFKITIYDVHVIYCCLHIEEAGNKIAEDWPLKRFSVAFMFTC